MINKSVKKVWHLHNGENVLIISCNNVIIHPFINSGCKKQNKLLVLNVMFKTLRSQPYTHHIPSITLFQNTIIEYEDANKTKFIYSHNFTILMLPKICIDSSLFTDEPFMISSLYDLSLL